MGKATCNGRLNASIMYPVLICMTLTLLASPLYEVLMILTWSMAPVIGSRGYGLSSNSLELKDVLFASWVSGKLMAVVVSMFQHIILPQH
jgi:hypothetical protein